MCERYMRIDEAASYLGFSIATLYGWTSRRMIPHFKQGGRLRFDRLELDAWMKESAVGTLADPRTFSRGPGENK